MGINDKCDLISLSSTRPTFLTSLQKFVFLTQPFLHQKWNIQFEEQKAIVPVNSNYQEKDPTYPAYITVDVVGNKWKSVSMQLGLYLVRKNEFHVWNQSKGWWYCKKFNKVCFLDWKLQMRFLEECHRIERNRTEQGDQAEGEQDDQAEGEQDDQAEGEQDDQAEGEQDDQAEGEHEDQIKAETDKKDHPTMADPMELSNYLEELYLSISQEQDRQIIDQVLAEFRSIFEQHKEKDMNLEPFGSYITRFGVYTGESKSSDLDLSVYWSDNEAQTQDNRIKCLLKLKNSFETSKEFEIIDHRISTQVPVLMLKHRKYSIPIDLAFGNYLAVRNSDLLSLYGNLHPNVRKLITLIKLWSKKQKIGTSMGYLSQFSYNLMVIAYLQSRGFIPSLQTITSDKFSDKDWVDLKYNQSNMEKVFDIRYLKEIEKLKQIWTFPDATLGELFFGFFSHYHHFPFDQWSISIKTGTGRGPRIPKEKLFTLQIDDPFEERNLARTCSENINAYLIIFRISEMYHRLK